MERTASFFEGIRAQAAERAKRSSMGSDRTELGLVLREKSTFEEGVELSDDLDKDKPDVVFKDEDGKVEGQKSCQTRCRQRS